MLSSTSSSSSSPSPICFNLEFKNVRLGQPINQAGIHLGSFWICGMKLLQTLDWHFWQGQNACFSSEKRLLSCLLVSYVSDISMLRVISHFWKKKISNLGKWIFNFLPHVASKIWRKMNLEKLRFTKKNTFMWDDMMTIKGSTFFLIKNLIKTF